MTEGVFGNEYSTVYDMLYEEKDYEAECNFLEDIFETHGLNVKKILDLGCGTGGHLIPLINRGYEVTGVDRSPHMLSSLRKKTEELGLSCELIESDICSLDLGVDFDVVISIFAVMSYQTTNQKLSAACINAHKHLKSSGAFIFDGWNGLAVLNKSPKQEAKSVKAGSKKIIRLTEPVLDLMSHVCETKFNFRMIDGERIELDDEETHFMRFFFPQEISYFLEVAGFSRINFCPFMDVGGRLNESIWNMTVIARK